MTNDTPKPKPHNAYDKKRTMYVLIDGGANISVVQDASWMSNVKPAKANDVVMMNSHPAPVQGYGDLQVEVLDEASKKWRVLHLRGVAHVPSSQFNLLGWTAYADQIRKAAQSEPALKYFTETATLPLPDGTEISAKRRHGLFSLRARRSSSSSSTSSSSSSTSPSPSSPLRSSSSSWRAQPTAKENVAPAAKTEEEQPATKTEEEESATKTEEEPAAAAAAPATKTEEEQPATKTEEEPAADVTSRSRSRRRRERKKLLQSHSKDVPAAVSKGDDGSDNSQEEWGALVIAKAREAVKLFHCTLGHCTSVASIQAMLRAGQLVVRGEAAVRKCIMQMTASELECVACKKAATNKNHPKDSKSAQTPGMYIMDVSGKYWRSKRGFKYVLVVVPPNGKGIFCSFLRRKNGVAHAVKENRKLWEASTGEKMVTLRMDRAGEHQGRLVKYLTKKGIQTSFIATGASAGAAEAYIHLLQDAMSANLNSYADMHEGKRPVHLWPEAMSYSAFCRECTPSATNDGISMYERRTGRLPPFHKLLPWGTTVTAHIPRALRRKGDNKGRVARFVGFAENGDGYKMYDSKTNTFFTSNSVHPFVVSAGLGVSVENTTLLGATGKNVVDDHLHGAPNAADQDAAPLCQRRDDEGKHDGPEPLLNGGESDEDIFADFEPEEEYVGRSPRVRNKAQHMNMGHDQWQTLATLSAGGPDNIQWAERDALVVNLTRHGQHEKSKLTAKLKAVRNFLKARRGGIAATLPEGAIPDTEKQAMSGPDAPWWRAAMDEETRNMEKNKVMTSIPEEERSFEQAQRGTKPIKSRFVFDLKLLAPSSTVTGPTYRTFPDGRKVRYKCRMVAKGFLQKEGVDFDPDKIYAPTPQMDSIRLMLAQTLGLGWNLRQLDVTAAFLIASLPEEEQMLMELPNGRGLVKLLRSIYGLRQSAHRWHQEINGTLLEHGFQCVDADQGVYVMYGEDGQLKCCMCLHVDDLLISAPDDVLNDVTTSLKAAYDMREENADWFLKIRITRSTDRQSMSLSQPDYAASIVKACGLDPVLSKPANTPMADPLFKGTDIPFTEEEESEMTDVYETYGTVVGMLGHLCNATRPDLSYSVNQCRSYTSNPRRHHWEALKRIVRYLKGTLNFGLVYSMVHGKDQLHAYCDADWATNEDDRKSVSGNVFMYMGAAIGWKSIKQTAVARSTAEAELAALDITARDALWYRKMIEALRMSTSKTIPLFEDNAAASAIANGSQWSAKTKHVATRFFAVRDDVLEKRVEVLPVDTADNVADFFTKPLGRTKFEKFRGLMGVRDVLCVF